MLKRFQVVYYSGTLPYNHPVVRPPRYLLRQPLYSGPKKKCLVLKSFSYNCKEAFNTTTPLIEPGVPLYGFLLCFYSPIIIPWNGSAQANQSVCSAKSTGHIINLYKLHIYKDIILSCRKWACKEKEPVENGESSHHSEPCESTSDSENEVLRERIKKTRVKASSDGKKEKKCQNASKTSVTTRESENKQTNKFCARQELQQQGFDSPSPSTEIQEDDFSIVTFIKPTPQPDKKRSIFTRRLHRSPSTSFDHLEDFAISYTEMQQNQSGLTNHQLKTISNHKRTKTDLVHKSGIVIKLDTSPLIKMKKRQRKRVMSLSSDSD